MMVARGGPDAAQAERALVKRGRSGLRRIRRLLPRRPPDERVELWRAVGAFKNLESEAAWILRRGLRSRVPSDRLGVLQGLQRLRPRWLGRILMRRIDEPDAAARELLAEILGSLGRRVEDALAARQDDASAHVREVALRALALRWKGEAQQTLLARGLLDPAGQIRLAAISLAAVTRDAVYTDPLVTLAHRGEKEEAKQAALALTELPHSQVHLTRLLADASVPLSSARVAMNFLREKRRHAFDLLMPALVRLPSKRRAVLIGPVLAKPTAEEIRDLVAFVNHPHPMRAELAEAWLSEIGPRADETIAITILSAHASLAQALRAYLQRRPGGGITPAIVQRARDGSLTERLSSIQVIGVLGTPPAREQLIDLLESPEPQVRAATARAVADLEAANPLLLALSADGKPEVRVAAVESLTRQFGTPAWQARLRALRDDDEMVRLSAIRSFSGTRHPEALARLENCVMAGTPSERQAAVTAIAKSPTTQAAVKLVEMVAHRDPMVRKAALAYVDSL